MELLVRREEFTEVLVDPRVDVCDSGERKREEGGGEHS
jgi:hypothetical protein